MNDFSREGGATIRMYGILNELAKQGENVTLISNAKGMGKFDPSIKHINIGYSFSPKDKRSFQGVVGALPLSIALSKYKGLIDRLKTVIQQNSFEKRHIIFFEYLDNTIGYVLKKKGVIAGYINDLHGIATVEFKFQADHARSFLEKVKFLSKYCISNLLDTKVFNNAYGLIFASKVMQEFFVELYPEISSGKNVVIPYVLSPDIAFQSVDDVLKKKLSSDLHIHENDIVIFFAGIFKKTGGVPDLISAVSNLIPKQKRIKLVLVGDGVTMEECKNLVREKGLDENVHFIGRTPYHYLRTYQDIATIIVCPDKMNLYSELIIHVKYLDALMSGKIVINGDFKSVKEVNVDDALSVSFKPSNIESLTNAIAYSIDNLKALKIKYRNNAKYASENLTYRNYVHNLKALKISDDDKG
jgi:glycosyltransferase involved in cell wall biosynthesis